MISPQWIPLEEFAVDPLLGGFVEASPGQRLVLRLLDGLPPANAEQRELFEAIASRAWGEDLATPRRTVALIMGADSGKSLTAALLLLHRALFADLSGLRPGQRGVGLLVAPDTRLARIPLDYIKGIIETSPVIAAEVEGDPLAETIRFTRGSEVTILPATIGGRATRGRRFVSVILEETAYFRDQDYTVNDQDIVRAVRPRLLPGAQLVAISTPYRKLGWLYEIFRAEHGRSRRALVLQAPTAVMRPDKSAASIEDEYLEDPTSAAAELGAEFLENVSDFLSAADVEAVTDEGVDRRPPEDGFHYTAATDPSGLRNDHWALTVFGRRGEEVRQFVSTAWPPGISVDRLIGELSAILKPFGLTTLVSDQYGSEVTKAHFTRAGINVQERPFTSSANSAKALGFKALKELIVGRQIRLLDDPVLSRELKLLEVTRLSGGGERIAAPGRLHDDRACACALAAGEIAGCQETDLSLYGWIR